MSLFNIVQNGLQVGFGKTILDALPIQARETFSKITNRLGELQSGNFDEFALGVLEDFGIGTTNRHFNKKTAMLGGLSPQETLTLYQRHQGIEFCRKNLWFLEVSSALSGENELFNMFAYNMDFSPVTLTGEKKQIGASHVDLVSSSDPVEMTITTLDDVSGSIKQWFEAHGSACAASDGTVGVPADYAIRIKVTHAFVDRNTDKDGNGLGYVSKGLFRVGNMSLGLSRSEQALSEITMSFVQLDTFMAY
jgi:hypothetical protein